MQIWAIRSMKSASILQSWLLVLFFIQAEVRISVKPYSLDGNWFSNAVLCQGKRKRAGNAARKKYQLVTCLQKIEVCHLACPWSVVPILAWRGCHVATWRFSLYLSILVLSRDHAALTSPALFLWVLGCSWSLLQQTGRRQTKEVGGKGQKKQRSIGKNIW